MDIKELREKANMTRSEFAEYFNIPKGTIRNWEQGFRRPAHYVIEMMEFKLRSDGYIPKEEDNH